MRTDNRDLVSISDFARNPLSYVNDLSNNRRKVILRNNEPVAVLVTAEELERLDTERRDALDLVLALTRKAADGGARHSVDEVLAEFGINPDDNEDNEG